MTWVYAESLWGLVPVICIIVITGIVRRHTWRRLKILGQDSAEWLVRLSLRDFCLALFMVFAVLTIADPRRIGQSKTGHSSGLDAAIAIDVSRSMLVEDISPNRLRRSIAALGMIIQKLENARFSFTVFKGDAQTLVPMTQDGAILDLWINRLGTGLLTSPGTNLESALRAASSSFPAVVSRNRALLLITDGESLTGDVNRVARELIQDGIPVYAIITGTINGGPIPLRDGKVTTGDSEQPVISRANFNSVKRLTEDTGGSVYDLSQTGAIGRLIERIELDQDFSETSNIDFTGNYRYRMYLLPAMAMLLFYFMGRIIPWRR